MSYLLFKELSINYDNKIITNNFSLSVEQGDKLCIKGASGKGKTTLINAILGFERKWNSGALYFNDKLIDKATINSFRTHLSYLPQDVNFYKGSVNDFIYLPFTFKINKHLLPSEMAIWELFDIFTLDRTLLYKNMDTVSGGEKQRIALISILLLKKDILILDEPTSALDAVSKKAVIAYVMSQKTTTVISASHDVDWIAACNKIIEL